jgi:hypothetical protein
MPKAFDDILNAIKKNLSGQTNPRTGKKYSESDIYAIAVATYKKKFGHPPSREDTFDIMKEIDPKFTIVEYIAPISVSESSNKDFTIQGIAIEETTSRNNIKYMADDLKKAVESLKDKAILDSHNTESVFNIMGRTTDAWFDDSAKAVKFKAKIMDEKIKQMIQDGRIKNVSIGAKVDSFETADEGVQIPKGIEFLELSVVAVPGVAGATISQALFEKFDFITQVNEIYNSLNDKGENIMEKEELKTTVVEAVTSALPKNEVSVEEKTKLDDEIKSLRKENEELKTQVAQFLKEKKDALIAQVLEAERIVGWIKETEMEVEKVNLEKLSEDALKTILEKAKKMKKEEVKPQEQVQITPKSVVQETVEAVETPKLIIERGRLGASIWMYPKDPRKR